MGLPENWKSKIVKGYLDLSGMQLDDIDAGILANNGEVTSLNVSNNLITDAGAALLSKSASIRARDIADNDLTGDGVAALAANKQIKELVLGRKPDDNISPIPSTNELRDDYIDTARALGSKLDYIKADIQYILNENAINAINANNSLTSVIITSPVENSHVIALANWQASRKHDGNEVKIDGVDVSSKGVAEARASMERVALEKLNLKKKLTGLRRGNECTSEN